MSGSVLERSAMFETQILPLADEATFVKVLTLVARVCHRAYINLSQSVFEVSASMQEGSPYQTFVARWKGEVVGYLCGRRNNTSFFILQGCCTKPALTRVAWEMVRERLEGEGVTTYELLTVHPPRVFEKYGFKLERYYMTLKG